MALSNLTVCEIKNKRFLILSILLVGYNPRTHQCVNPHFTRLQSANIKAYESLSQKINKDIQKN